MSINNGGSIPFEAIDDVPLLSDDEYLATFYPNVVPGSFEALKILQDLQTTIENAYEASQLLNDSDNSQPVITADNNLMALPAINPDYSVQPAYKYHQTTGYHSETSPKPRSQDEAITIFESDHESFFNKLHEQAKPAGNFNPLKRNAEFLNSNVSFAAVSEPVTNVSSTAPVSTAQQGQFSQNLQSESAFPQDSYFQPNAYYEGTEQLNGGIMYPDVVETDFQDLLRQHQARLPYPVQQIPTPQGALPDPKHQPHRKRKEREESTSPEMHQQNSVQNKRVKRARSSSTGSQPFNSTGAGIPDNSAAQDGEEVFASQAGAKDDKQEPLENLKNLENRDPFDAADKWIRQNVDRFKRLGIKDDDLQEVMQAGNIVKTAKDMRTALLAEPEAPQSKWTAYTKDYYKAQQAKAKKALEGILEDSFGQDKALAFCIRLVRTVCDLHSLGYPASHDEVNPKEKNKYRTETDWKCSARCARVIECIRANKQIAVDVIDFDVGDMTTFVRCPGQYLQRKRSNTCNNAEKVFKNAEMKAKKAEEEAAAAAASASKEKSDDVDLSSKKVSKGADVQAGAGANEADRLSAIQKAPSKKRGRKPMVPMSPQDVQFQSARSEGAEKDAELSKSKKCSHNDFTIGEEDNGVGDAEPNKRKKVTQTFNPASVHRTATGRLRRRASGINFPRTEAETTANVPASQQQLQMNEAPPQSTAGQLNGAVGAPVDYAL